VPHECDQTVRGPQPVLHGLRGARRGTAGCEGCRHIGIDPPITPSSPFSDGAAPIESASVVPRGTPQFSVCGRLVTCRPRGAQSSLFLL
jgi:hypothetical protein